MPRLDRINRAFRTRPQKLSLRIQPAQLTVAAGSQALSLGTPPAGARALGAPRVALVTEFTGGTVSACVVDVGPTADANKVGDGADIFAAPVDGEASASPAGIAPNADIGGVEQFATVIATGDTVDDITAGDCTVELLFAVVDE